MNTIRIGFLGLGTVGQGVWEQLILKSKVWNEKLDVDFVPVKASVRNLSKRRDVSIPEHALTTDSMSIVEDPSIDVIIELIGGIRDARELTLRAFANGKSVITANKALICEHGRELLEAAQLAGVQYLYEASVAGGIPIIKVIQEAFVGNRIHSLQGILNGTSNYILTRMERASIPYPDALAEAKALGYVEQDESLDLDGFDAAHKLIILAYLCYQQWFSIDDIHVEGIRNVSLHDMRAAARQGYKIKLIATLRRIPEQDCIECSVRPSLVPMSNNLAAVEDAFNGVCIQGDIVGTSFLIGRGAGREPTASAVISDIVDLVRNPKERKLMVADRTASLATPEAIHQSYYLRIEVDDVRGVLSEITQILSRNNISISTIDQSLDTRRASASITLTTHDCRDQDVKLACQAILNHSFVKDDIVVFPILEI